MKNVAFAECASCPLVNKTLVYGRGELSAYETARLVIVGEGPGRTEVRHGQVFIGPSGELLNRMMERFITGSYWITNTALCGVATEKQKSSAAIHCKKRLFHLLKELHPTLIITLGNIPTSTVLRRPSKITKMRGVIHAATIGKSQVAVLPTYHPAAALRNSDLIGSIVLDFKRAQEYLVSPPKIIGPVDPKPRFEVTRDYERVLREAEASSFPVLDLETASLDMETARILCAVVATRENIYIIPGDVMHRSEFKRALQACQAKWSGHNSKFDRNVLIHQLGVRVQFAFDTMLAHYVFDTRQNTHDLKHIAAERYAAPAWDEPISRLLKEKKSSSYADVPQDVLYKYAAYDGYYQRALTTDLAVQLVHSPDQMKLFKTLLMPGSNALSNAEAQGVCLDRKALDVLYPKYQRIVGDAEHRVCEIAGHPVNPRSPKQVAELLFDELGLPEINGRSTSARHVLKKYEHPHPVVQALLEYREANTVVTRYLKGLDKYISPSGRVHSRYNLHRTATGRLSSAEPNLQNQPSRNAELKRDIKNLFLADPGNLWSDCDYSQIEYRMIAFLSKDPYLVESYRAGKDLHAEMAKDGWGDDFTYGQRSLAKGLNFGLLYGRSVEGILADGDLDIPEALAYQIAHNFYTKMPLVVEYNRTIRNEVRRTGVIKSINGRIRKFYEVLTARYDGDWNRIYREAVNTLPQGMASDATLAAIIALDKAGFDVRMTVHDSITVQGPAQDIEEICREQKKIMTAAATELYGDLVPYPTDGQVGRSWGSLVDLEEYLARRAA